MELFKGVLELLPVGILIVGGKSVNFINCRFMSIFGFKSQDDNKAMNQFNFLVEKNKDKSEFNIEQDSKKILILKQTFKENIIYAATDVTVTAKLQMAEIEEKFKGKLMMLIMHEFKTPLNWLSGSLSSLIPSESTKDLLKMAKHAVNLLSLYVDDIAFYNSKQNENDTQMCSKHFSIHKSIYECKEFVASELTTNQLDLQVNISEDIPIRVRGDNIKYSQVLINILCNSVKSCQQNNGKIVVKATLHNKTILTTVEDNGIPLSEGEIQLLLKPLARCNDDNLQVRFGIGMLLCRDMCKRMQGDFNVEYKTLNCYSFWLPYSVQFDEETASTHLTFVQKKAILLECESKTLEKNASITDICSVIDQSRKNILIVDDTPFNNLMLKQMLKLLNVSCFICINGKEAFDYCSGEKRKGIHLILMDINMPVMDGIEVYAYIGYT